MRSIRRIVTCIVRHDFSNDIEETITKNFGRNVERRVSLKIDAVHFERREAAAHGEQ